MVEVWEINRIVDDAGADSRELEQETRERIAAAVEELRPLIDEFTSNWERLGLSGREAQIAAYRELGFSDEAIAIMLELSPDTVNERSGRARVSY